MNGPHTAGFEQIIGIGPHLSGANRSRTPRFSPTSEMAGGSGAIASNGRHLAGNLMAAAKEAPEFVSFQLFPLSDRRRILRPMAMEDNITLGGDFEDRVVQLLRMARHYARLAQSEARPRKQDALTELEDTLADQLAAIENADEDDKADAEESGEAERERRAWRPLRAA